MNTTRHNKRLTNYLKKLCERLNCCRTSTLRCIIRILKVQIASRTKVDVQVQLASGRLMTSSSLTIESASLNGVKSSFNNKLILLNRALKTKTLRNVTRLWTKFSAVSNQMCLRKSWSTMLRLRRAKLILSCHA